MTHILRAVLLAGGLLCVPATAATVSDVGFERMALCQDSWLDWRKTGDPRLQQFAEHLAAGYVRHGDDPYLVPKTGAATIAGFRVLQLYPGSVGTGVGFSALVDAPFDQVRAGLERSLGKPLGHCEASDGMHSCELQVAERRTVMLMTMDSPKGASTLLGCYYYYER